MANTNFTAEQQKAIDNYKKNMNILKERGEWTTAISKGGLNELKKLGIGSNANGFFLLDSTPTSNNNTTTNTTSNNNKTTNTTSNTTSNTPSYTTIKVNPNFTGGSVVNYLNSIGMDSSKAARKNYAALYGIKNYDFSAEKNKELLDALRTGKMPTSAAGTNMSGGSDLSGLGPGVNHGTNLNENISYDKNGWDYGISDQDRLDEMRAHIEGEGGYIVTHPEYFMSRAEFNRAFEYDKRTSQAQKDLLDEMREKYGIGKSDAPMKDTQILTQEKEFEQQKRDDKLSTLQDIIDKLNKRRDDIELKISGNLKDARDNLDDIANEYAGKLGDIQDFYNGYYKNMMQDYNRMMNGEISSLSSDLSGRGLTGVMRNSVNGIRRNYSKMINSLLKEKNDLDNQFAKGLADFNLTIQQERDNLDNNEYNLLVTGYNNLKATLDALSDAQQQSIDEINRARENWYKARSDEAADVAGNAAKKESKASAYRAMNFNQRAQYLNDNLVTIIGDGTTLDNYNYNVIKYAAENYNDLTEALHYIAQNAKYDKKTAAAKASTSNSSSGNDVYDAIVQSMSTEELNDFLGKYGI